MKDNYTDSQGYMPYSKEKYIAPSANEKFVTGITAEVRNKKSGKKIRFIQGDSGLGKTWFAKNLSSEIGENARSVYIDLNQVADEIFNSKASKKETRDSDRRVEKREFEEYFGSILWNEVNDNLENFEKNAGFEQRFKDALEKCEKIASEKATIFIFDHINQKSFSLLDLLEAKVLARFVDDNNVWMIFIGRNNTHYWLLPELSSPEIYKFEKFNKQEGEDQIKWIYPDASKIIIENILAISDCNPLTSQVLAEELKKCKNYRDGYLNGITKTIDKIFNKVNDEDGFLRRYLKGLSIIEPFKEDHIRPIINIVRENFDLENINKDIFTLNRYRNELLDTQLVFWDDSIGAFKMDANLKRLFNFEFHERMRFFNDYTGEGKKEDEEKSEKIWNDINSETKKLLNKWSDDYKDIKGSKQYIQNETDKLLESNFYTALNFSKLINKQPAIDEISEILNSSNLGKINSIIYLTGESGTGKSFLCNNLYKQVKTEQNSFIIPSLVIDFSYLGNRCKLGLLRSIEKILCRNWGVIYESEEAKNNYEPAYVCSKLINEKNYDEAISRIRKLSEKKRIVLIFDSLEKLICAGTKFISEDESDKKSYLYNKEEVLEFLQKLFNIENIVFILSGRDISFTQIKEIFHFDERTSELKKITITGFNQKNYHEYLDYFIENNKPYDPALARKIYRFRHYKKASELWKLISESKNNGREIMPITIAILLDYLSTDVKPEKIFEKLTIERIKDSSKYLEISLSYFFNEIASSKNIILSDFQEYLKFSFRGLTRRNIRYIEKVNKELLGKDCDKILDLEWIVNSNNLKKFYYIKFYEIENGTSQKPNRRISYHDFIARLLNEGVYKKNKQKTNELFWMTTLSLDEIRSELIDFLEKYPNNIIQKNNLAEVTTRIFNTVHEYREYELDLLIYELTIAEGNSHLECLESFYELCYDKVQKLFEAGDLDLILLFLDEIGKWLSGNKFENNSDIKNEIILEREIIKAKIYLNKCDYKKVKDILSLNYLETEINYNNPAEVERQYILLRNSFESNDYGENFLEELLNLKNKISPNLETLSLREDIAIAQVYELLGDYYFWYKSYGLALKYFNDSGYIWEKTKCKVAYDRIVLKKCLLYAIFGNYEIAKIKAEQHFRSAMLFMESNKLYEYVMLYAKVMVEIGECRKVIPLIENCCQYFKKYDEIGFQYLLAKIERAKAQRKLFLREKVSIPSNTVNSSLSVEELNNIESKYSETDLYLNSDLREPKKALLLIAEYKFELGRGNREKFRSRINSADHDSNFASETEDLFRSLIDENLGISSQEAFLDLIWFYFYEKDFERAEELSNEYINIMENKDIEDNYYSLLLQSKVYLILSVLNNEKDNVDSRQIFDNLMEVFCKAELASQIFDKCENLQSDGLRENSEGYSEIKLNVDKKASDNKKKIVNKQYCPNLQINNFVYKWLNDNEYIEFPTHRSLLNRMREYFREFTHSHEEKNNEESERLSNLLIKFIPLLTFLDNYFDFSNDIDVKSFYEFL